MTNPMVIATPTNGSIRIVDWDAAPEGTTKWNLDLDLAESLPVIQECGTVRYDAPTGFINLEQADKKMNEEGWRRPAPWERNDEANPDERPDRWVFTAKASWTQGFRKDADMTEEPAGLPNFTA